jgi:hypothetical protein
MRPFTEWTVLPHGKLAQLDNNILTVTGDLHMPLGDVPRRMTVVRLSDSRLVIFSAIALDEHEMAQLEGWGTPAYLIVPGELHRMDAKIWKDRYPLMKVITPAGVRSKVEELVPVDATHVEFDDPRVRYVTVPGTEDREAALEVHGKGGTTLIINDLIWNLDDRPGFSGWLFRVLGFTGREPKMPGIIQMRAVKQKAELRQQLQAWSQISDLNRIVVSHGDIVLRDPAGALARLAVQLVA